jgi:hypothetical protein
VKECVFLLVQKNLFADFAVLGKTVIKARTFLREEESEEKRCVQGVAGEMPGALVMFGWQVPTKQGRWGASLEP